MSKSSSSKKNESPKTETAVKLVLISFIALLAFAVGAFVGKQVSDNHRQVAELEGGTRTTASIEESEFGQVDENEIASLEQEFLKAEASEIKEKPSAKDSETPAQAADGYRKIASKERAQDIKKEMKKPKSAAATVEKAAQRVARDKAPAADPKPKRIPNSSLPALASSALGKYTVQVASYQKESEAKTHAAKLKAKGYDAFFIEANVKGTAWYRVSIGLFANSKKASDYRAELSKDKAIPSSIVQKIVK